MNSTKKRRKVLQKLSTHCVLARKTLTFYTCSGCYQCLENNQMTTKCGNLAKCIALTSFVRLGADFGKLLDRLTTLIKQ